jgi:hypothetical protein
MFGLTVQQAMQRRAYVTAQEAVDRAWSDPAR